MLGIGSVFGSVQIYLEPNRKPHRKEPSACRTDVKPVKPKPLLTEPKENAATTEGMSY